MNGVNSCLARSQGERFERKDGRRTRSPEQVSGVHAGWWKSAVRGVLCLCALVRIGQGVDKWSAEKRIRFGAAGLVEG